MAYRLPYLAKIQPADNYQHVWSLSGHNVLSYLVLRARFKQALNFDGWRAP